MNTYLLFLLFAVLVFIIVSVSWLYLRDSVPFLRHEARFMYKMRLEADYYHMKVSYSAEFVGVPEVEAILKKRSRAVKWSELYAAEKIIVSRTPPDLLMQRWGSLVCQYRDIAPECELKLAEKAHLIAEMAPREAVAVNSVELTDRLQKIRRVLVRREATKNGVSFIVALVAFVFLLCMAAMYHFYNAPNASAGPHPISVILFCGALGGFVSAQARIQSIPEVGSRNNDLSLLRIAAGVLLAVFTGALGALLLYVMIAAKFINGELLPNLESGATGPYVGFFGFVEHCNPATHIDAAKMVIWSFAAGFSERLVPDQVFFLVSQLPTRTRKENG